MNEKQILELLESRIVKLKNSALKYKASDYYESIQRRCLLDRRAELIFIRREIKRRSTYLMKNGIN